MSLVVRLTGLWPGLLQAWLAGSPQGLLLAMAFGVTASVAILGTQGSLSEIVGESWAPVVIAVAWSLTVAIWVSGRFLVRHDATIASAGEKVGSGQQADAELREAQNKYLRGHWIEAETQLAGLLRKHPHDVEARLLLAGILRRTERADGAKRVLVLLRREPSAQHWRLEVDRELERMATEQQSSTVAARAA